MSEATPYSVRADFVLAADGLEAAEKKWDALILFAASIGLIPEGGSLMDMDANDVIPGSPLAEALRGGSGE